MRHLLKSCALMTVFLSLYSFAEPNYNADPQYSSCYAEAKGNQKAIQECKNKVILRGRIDGYYKYFDIPGYSEYYDRFEDSYDFKWQAKWYDLNKPSLAANINMDKHKDGVTVYLFHVSIIKDDIGSERLCRETYWLVDGKRLEPQNYYNNHDGNFHMSSSDLSEDQFRKIAYAKKAEFKYCDVEGELSRKDQEAMKYVLKRYLDEKDVTLPVGDTFNKKR